MPGRVHEPSLVCPQCGSRFTGDLRFCPTCRLPLVLEPAPDTARKPTARHVERHERARKVKPQLSEGELVKVAWARNQSEAEFIQGLLLEEGVPSMLRRSRGFDVPDFLAAGPRDVMVPISGVDAAREILLQAEVIEPDDGGGRVAPRRLLAGLLIALALGALVIWLISLAVH
jgi:pimeloyl-ACP methyl ester carboxylesterase